MKARNPIARGIRKRQAHAKANARIALERTLERARWPGLTLRLEEGEALELFKHLDQEVGLVR